MNSNQTNAFFMSALLHGVIVALVLFFTYAVKESVQDQPKIFELVAGEGDNYMATEAPALGVAGGIKIAIPEPPAPKPEPPAAKAEPEPVAAAPVSAPPEPVIKRAPPVEAKPVEKAPNFANDIKRIAKKRQDRLEAKDRKEREAAERKAKEEALKNQRMTKADFDRQNKASASAPKAGASTPKIAKIDAEGIRNGVAGGSTNNKTSGASGKAMTREEGSAMELYFSLLKSRLAAALDKPPGLADSLVAIVEVDMLANGTMTGARIKKSSGSAEFDQAALAAVTRVRSIGARPDKKSETITIPFRMRELDES